MGTFFVVAQTLAAQDAGGGAGLIQMAMIAIPMIAVMYFLMIRPESKRRNEHQTMLTALKRGDEIVLTSGIIGKIHAIEDKSLVVEIADKTRIKVLKIAVSGPASRYLGGPEPKKIEEPAKADEKKPAEDGGEKKSA
jgi:preprotein translocase subunit YajC